jgi:hypothetical protein
MAVEGLSASGLLDDLDLIPGQAVEATDALVSLPLLRRRIGS